MRRFFKNSGGLSTLLALALAVFAVGTMFADESDDDQGVGAQEAGVAAVGGVHRGINRRYAHQR